MRADPLQGVVSCLVQRTNEEAATSAASSSLPGPADHRLIGQGGRLLAHESAKWDAATNRMLREGNTETQVQDQQ